MEFKSISKPRKYFKYAECEEGQELVIGRYKGTVPSNYSDNHLFEVEWEEEDVVLNSSGHLNWQLDNVELGTMCKIIYKGQHVLEKGPYKGKPSHQFDVQIASDSGRKTSTNKEAIENPTKSNLSPQASDSLSGFEEL